MSEFFVMVSDQHQPGAPKGYYAYGDESQIWAAYKALHNKYGVKFYTVETPVAEFAPAPTTFEKMMENMGKRIEEVGTGAHAKTGAFTDELTAIATDTSKPVTDRVGGIFRKLGLPGNLKEVRDVADKVAAGAKTASTQVTQGYAVVKKAAEGDVIARAELRAAAGVVGKKVGEQALEVGKQAADLAGTAATKLFKDPMAIVTSEGQKFVSADWIVIPGNAKQIWVTTAFTQAQPRETLNPKY